MILVVNVQMTDLLFVMHDKYVFINAEKQITRENRQLNNILPFCIFY
jgi:hypothetical protein